MAKIFLKNIGRSKVNKVIDAVGDEEELAEIALRECRKYLMSSETYLAPDDDAGLGYWKLYAGMYHVGDVEIVI